MRILRNQGAEVINFDDPRLTYYYQPWEKSMVMDQPVIRTDKYNDYVDIWRLQFTHFEWWSVKAPENGVVGFKIWGKDWEIQELLDLYSPTKDSKIELIKSWDFATDDYTVTLLNTGEKWGDSIGNYLVHSHFIIS